MISSAIDVRCVSGCDGGGLLSTANLPALAGVVLGLVAVVLAFLAWRAAQGSLEIARTEHQSFMDQISSRADFDLTIELLTQQARPGVITDNAANMNLLYRLGIKNSGNKAAGATIINCLLPPTVQDAYWSDSRGSALTDQSVHSGLMPASPEDTVPGSAQPARYLNRVLERISLKGHYVLHVTIRVDRNRLTSDEFGVRFKAQADELPDDVEERCVNDLLIFE